jgi:glycosyltransferase involved in cell wall biosynthesis
MIQIYYGNDSFGPGKVLSNLTRGLQILKENYLTNPSDLNPEFPAYCLSQHPILQRGHDNMEHFVIGPNLCVLPCDLPVVLEQRYKCIVAPSLWVKKLYEKWLSPDKVFVWPVGIDSSKFVPSSTTKTTDCLLYFKDRGEHELAHVESLLRRYHQSYKILRYGSYAPQDFNDLISECSYGFLLDNTESQGIAVQEMMSCDLPIFVWDKVLWDHRGEEYACEATSVPYWDHSCGEKVENPSSLSKTPEKFEKFLENLNDYSPRKFVKENLSLKRQAQQLLDIYKKT